MDLFLKKSIMNFRNQRHVIKDTEQLLFMKRLLKLLQNGYPLVKALEIVKWNKNFTIPATTISDELIAGKYLDETFQKAGFHQSIVAYLFFVRFNNDLQTSLKQSITMFEQRITNKKKFTQIIRYPLILTFFFLLLLFFLKQNVLPSFIDLFQYSHDSASTVLYSMIFINVLSNALFICIILTIIVFIGWKLYYRKWPIDRQMKIYKKIPIYRTFLRLQISYYFSTHISMFLQTGMSIKDILRQISTQGKIPVLAYYADLMQAQLKQGYQLEPLLMNFYFIDKQISSIFESNNNYDSLAKDLSAYADYVINEIERKTVKTMTLIQPVFFVLLACFIIIIYLMLMWPMFQLIQTV